MRLALLAMMFVMNAQPLPAAEPFWLQLTSLSEAWLPGSGVVRVPADTSCQELRVRLEKAWSSRSRVDALQLSIDDRYPRFKRLSEDDGFVMKAETHEPRGLIPKESHRIEASLEGGSSIHTGWTVERWEKKYIEARAEGGQGSIIEINLEEPFGGLVLAGRGDSKVRLRGDLRGGSLSAKLTVNDQVIHRVASAAGYRFDEEVPVPAGARDVVLTALDGDGAQTVLVLLVMAN